ncbi:YcnI family protein [Psychrobacillus sp. NPDC058041]|uniref:YcnI family copper-binding membrane protein n=1 Tax=Psychrobacillus sp. NPDC058041 TaxID=3346310 RepID=UPI0036D7E54F
MKNKKWMAPIIALLFIFLIAPIAEAHVTVRPGESSTNAWEKYSVRVPVEKDINTTKIELRVPKGINLVSVMPVDNWDYKFEKDANDIITSVTWTAANGGGIKPNEFMEFYFIASNPSEPGEFSWEALQTYEDGSVVEWTGAPGTDEPASVTKVVVAGAVGATENAHEESSESITSGSVSWLPITLSSVAILLALIGLFRKKA